MGKRPRDVQYTVRGIPPEVDRALRRKAAHRVGPRADFDDLVGKWTADPAFDEIISAPRKIDPDKWK